MKSLMHQISSRIEDGTKQTVIPTKIIRGLNILIDNRVELINFPFSTYETTLFASVSRGCKISRTSPIRSEILSNNMTRSVILQCKNITDIIKLINFLEQNTTKQRFQDIINQTSSHCVLSAINYQVISNIIYLRFSYNTHEAAGHNITTIASNAIAKYIVKNRDLHGVEIEYISNSGNTCVDKKVSAINSICNRGKHIISNIVVSERVCRDVLHTTPEKITQLNLKKNLIGSIIAGSICSANTHYANMLAAIYLPLGQDVANIVEGSQGVTYCEIDTNGDLYFSVNLPNIICGTIGNGKNTDFVRENLALLKCNNSLTNGTTYNSIRMAKIIGAIILCGELSLMAALTNADELVRSHKLFERK